MVKNFLGALLGVLIVEAIDFPIDDPKSFDWAAETLEAIILAAVVTVVITLFNRWRDGSDPTANEGA